MAIKYTHCDAVGYERGDNGKKKPKVARIYILESVDEKNQLAHVKSYDVFGQLHQEVFPAHTIARLPQPLTRNR